MELNFHFIQGHELSKLQLSFTTKVLHYKGWVPELQMKLAIDTLHTLMFSHHRETTFYFQQNKKESLTKKSTM